MLLYIAFATAFLAVFGNTDYLTRWNEFKITHGKVYNSAEEENYRFQIFQEKLKKIDAHNALYDKGLETYTLGINQFSDLTAEEWERSYNYMLGNTSLDLDLISNATYYKPKIQEVPEVVDWRASGKVTPVKYQRLCGSCYAFATVAAVESQFLIKRNASLDLSEQEIVDCDNKSHHCHGGYTPSALTYIIDNGIVQEKDYIYTAVRMSCVVPSNVPKVLVKGLEIVESRDILQALAEVGPLVIGVDAKEWPDYKGGIFVPKLPFDSFSHAALLVGYNKSKGNNYWIIKNSWSKYWGEEGYMYLQMNTTFDLGFENHVIIVPNVY